MRRQFQVLGLVLAIVSQSTGTAQAGPAVWVDAMTIPDQAISYMSAFADGSAFVWLHNRPLSIHVSTDYGLTFTPKDAPAEYGSGFEMVTPRRGYFLQDDRVFMTADGAASWERLPDPDLPGRKWEPGPGNFKGYDLRLESIAPVETTRRVAFGGRLKRIKRKKNEGESSCYSGVSNATVLIAADGGRSGKYRVTKLPFSGTVTRLGFLDARHGWVLATEMEVPENPCDGSNSIRNVVMLTSDGGRTYREAHSCPHSGESGPFGSLGCTSVAMASPRRIIIGKTDGWVYVSTNGGYGFEPYQQLVPPGMDNLKTHWVSGIEFASAKVGYAVAKGGGTYRTNDGGLSWGLEPSSQSTWGIGVGDIAVGDEEHAIAGGPNSIIARVPN